MCPLLLPVVAAVAAVATVATARAILREALPKTRVAHQHRRPSGRGCSHEHRLRICAHRRLAECLAGGWESQNYYAQTSICSYISAPRRLAGIIPRGVVGRRVAKISFFM
eukprot:12136069-Alexandrium_andersonii.AAC.1